MKTSQIILLGAASAALLSISACGGGGGGGNAYVTPANGGTAASRSAVDLATELLTKTNQLFATSAPSTGVASQSLSDDCYLSNGGTKPYWVQKFDENPTLSQASNAYRIGSTRTGLTILAERNTTNSNGSARREIDVQYDINFTDGSKDTAARDTLIIGSSADSCATPQDLNTARFMGNRQIVETYVQSRNTRTENYSIATGNGVSVTSRRELNFGVNDPMGNATYVIVTGPGESTTNNVVYPFSLKLLSPKIIRDDPSMAVVGKSGYSSNYNNDDSFRACGFLIGSVFSATVRADIADCVGAGTTGPQWGVTLNSSVASNTDVARDAVFSSIKFVVGGVYTFNIYNDDGWKTTNGQVGKTPVATYTRTLEKLPYTFVEMGTVNVGVVSPGGATVTTYHKFPGSVSGTFNATPNPLYSVLSAGTAGSISATWSAPLALNDGDIFKAYNIGEFSSGPSVSNGAILRQYVGNPILGNTTSATFPVTAKPSTMSQKTYSEFALQYTNRNGGRIINYLVWR
jgi:hypothetical protein